MRASRGFTLPELLIVVTVLVVLMGAGLPSFNEFMRNQRVKTASFDLFSSLVLARNEAITRNSSVTVTPSAGAWTNGWTITYTDAGGNVIPIRVQEAIPNLTISGPLPQVQYRGSGRLSPATLALAPVQFQLSSSGETVVTRCISIDPSGRPSTKAAAC